ncbi:hypothetical protein J1605_021519 [Eschrichtius robustus]|uniref:Ferritin light chain n=1 Tax=Eschrichtius robustus TaxID=9764 RepID=A0AB34HEB0_ESCRO|nr:hypothetical protein J1605_021519 [Eschrichtius robustus]
MSSQICQNYSTEIEAVINCPVYMHLPASYTYCYPKNWVCLLDLQKPSQDEWGKTQAATEATVLMEKNLTQALLDLHALTLKHD